MPVDHIRYDILAQEALRGIVRTVLADAAKNGLPGEHHFYITFDTCADGVRLSPRMLAQYPKEMTIVLQHQFWDLVMMEDGFEVGLSFGGIAERLTVPFAAIKGFFDPSVQFGLQFEEIDETATQRDKGDKGDGGEEGEEPEDESTLPGAHRGSRRPRAAHEARAPFALPAVPAPANPEFTAAERANDEEANSETALPAEEVRKPQSGAEVVRLDRFRKK
jgi:uncharacterized protein